MTNQAEPRRLVPLFSTGQVVATPGALRLLLRLSVNPADLLARHVYGDFGDMCEEDLASNKLAVVHGTRVFSSYKLGEDRESTCWVITEWDRSVTTLLLPSEY